MLPTAFCDSSSWILGSENKMVTKEDIKKRDMQQLAHYRKQLAKNPRLTYLFVELTD